jgi:hypothetical protein
MLRLEPSGDMRRREFLGALGGAVAAWPLEVRAQQLKPAQPPKAMRRIAVLTGAAGSVSDARVRVLVQALGELGWLEARNVRFEIRHGGGATETLRQHAAELVALAPDVILANGGTATEHLLRATRTIPIDLHSFLIQWDPVLWIAWHGLAVTPQASRNSNTALARNGWSCSKRLARTLREWQSFEILLEPPGWASSRLSRPWRSRKG